MNGNKPGQNYIITNGNMAGECCTIRKNTIITHNTVVGNMAVSLDQTVLSNYSFPAVFCTAVNGYAFADGGIITNFGSSLFTRKLQILRNSGNDSSRKYTAVFTNSGTIHDGYIRAYPCSFSNDNIFMDSNKGLNNNIIGNFCLRVYVCEGLDH